MYTIKLQILIFCFYISYSTVSGENSDSNEIGFDSLSEYLQPDDIDNGFYDEIFMNNDTGNEVFSLKSNMWNDGRLCGRSCMGGIKKTCYYKFKIEHYSAMGYACGNCTCSNSQCINRNQCNNAHCITVDGIARNMITVNRRYPGPPIHVCKGDRIVVDVTNALQGKTATLHWHGMFQKQSPWMDGVSMLSQCPIVPGTTFRYDFIASEAGTHFWHDHAGLIKLDGVQGPLIVRENNDPNWFHYDYDFPSHTIFLTDWKHFMADEEFPDMKAFEGKRIEALLINGKGLFESGLLKNGDNYRQNNCDTAPVAKFYVKHGKSYRFRIVGSFCMMCAIEFSIENHDLTVIAVDGNSISPTTVDSLVITSGERFDVVIRALRPRSQLQPMDDRDSYWIQTRGIYPCNGTSQAALLVYNSFSDMSKRCPTQPRDYPQKRILNHPKHDIKEVINIKTSELTNANLVSPRISTPTFTSKFAFAISSHPYTVQEFKYGQAPVFFKPFTNGAPMRSTINGISSTLPSAPLFTQFKDVPKQQICSDKCINGSSRKSCEPCVHLIKIPLHTTIDFIISDANPYTGIVHPFHLHGHKFFVLEQGMMNSSVTVDSLMRKAGRIRKFTPPNKDTVIVPLGTYAIVRFYADNPGVWIFHCHYIYHNAVGMHVFLQVGEESDFLKPPQDFPKCGNYLPQII